MIFRFSHFARAVLVVAVLVSVMTCVRAEPAPASDRSPFMPEGAAGPGAAAATENAPLEYRGVVSTKSGKLYALYDPAKHQSVWVRLNEQGSDYVIRSADDTNDTITVNYQGRQMTLAMKQAKVETMAVSAPPVAPSTPNGIRPPPGMNPSSPANAAEEQRRLEAVAAEVRRRRMMRAQAAGQQPPMPPVQPGR